MSEITKDFSDAEFAVSSIVQQLAAVCYENSLSKGFWSEQNEVMSELAKGLEGHPNKEQLLKATENAFHAMKGDLMHSELGERTEAQRKDLKADKLPEGFSGEEEELADTIIRILDYAGRRKMKLGEAIVLKMRYNAGRPFMHGKKF